MRNETLEVCHRFLDLLEDYCARINKISKEYPSEDNIESFNLAKRFMEQLELAKLCVDGTHTYCYDDDKNCLRWGNERNI